MTNAMLVTDRSSELADVVTIDDLDNDSLVIRLTFTVNHLSRWLTPIHESSRLTRSLRRGEPSIKDLLLELRNEELRVFPKMHLIAVQNTPNLDGLPPVVRTPAQLEYDRQSTPLEVMAEFRRLRQSTTSLLRSLVDDAWDRRGVSRRERNWTIRGLAEHLAAHDLAVLSDMDVILDRSGVREGIAQVSRVHLPELLALLPVRLRNA